MALACLMGCSDEGVNLGGGLAVDRSALSSYAATWDGYIEALSFDGGSGRVRIVLDEAGHGSILFGEAVPPPLPVDADDPFPVIGPSLLENVQEGFAYELSDALVETERLRLRSDSGAYLDAACALQAPVEVVGEGSHACLASTSSLSRDGQCFSLIPSAPFEQEVPCARIELCSYCECTETACAAARPYEILLDAALEDDGATLVGTVRSFGPSGQVRLSKSP